MRDLEIRGAGNLLGAEPVGPHRRRRLRPLLPDGDRGGRRAEGRGAARAGRGASSTCPSTPTCPRDYVAREDAAPGGLPPAGGGHDRRPTSTTSAPSGRPLRPAARRRPRRCSTSPGCGPSALRLGIREVVVAEGHGAARRRSQLKTSAGGAAAVASRRDGVYKAELGEVQLPVPPKGDLPSMVVDFLRELRPPDGEQPEGHR